eukprot:10154788-Alexandrium_andersonii.AAC.1
MTENGNKLGEGLLRVLLLSLETKVQGQIPCDHPVFAWLTEYTGDVPSKHLVSKDGKTPYERLFGNPVHKEGLECLTSHNVLMEPRRRAGIWLGRRQGSTIHLAWGPEGQTAREVRAIQRWPASER